MSKIDQKVPKRSKRSKNVQKMTKKYKKCLKKFYKMFKKCPKNVLKMFKKCPKKWPKNVQKLTKNVQKMTKKCPKIDQKMSKKVLEKCQKNVKKIIFWSYFGHIFVILNFVFMKQKFRIWPVCMHTQNSQTKRISASKVSQIFVYLDKFTTFISKLTWESQFWVKSVIKGKVTILVNVCSQTLHNVWKIRERHYKEHCNLLNLLFWFVVFFFIWDAIFIYFGCI